MSFKISLISTVWYSDYMKRTTSGFTIVELLIVIVVIAMLAAISIVAYNGIQDRAARSTTTSAIASYTKAINLYLQDKGLYPDHTNACLGGSLNDNNRCYKITNASTTCVGSGSAYGKSAFDDEIKPYMGNTLAVPSQKSYTCGGAPFTGALYYAGSPTIEAFIFSIMKASVGACPAIAGLSVTTTNTQDEIIICRYKFPTI